jgi:hypothetical protein
MNSESDLTGTTSRTAKRLSNGAAGQKHLTIVISVIIGAHRRRPHCVSELT